MANSKTTIQTTNITLPTREVRTRFSPQTRVQLHCLDPHLTQQEFTEECDINNVILRYSATGELPPRLNARVAEFLDVSEIGDLHEALEQARVGNAFFESLPDQVKQAVGYDPMRLLDALDEHQRLRASVDPDQTKPDFKSENRLDSVPA